MKILGVLAGVAGALWSVVVVVRLVVAFVVAYHVVILIVVAVAGLLAVAWGITKEVQRHRAAVLEEQIRDRARWELVDAMSGPAFEDFVADLLRRDGRRDVCRIGRSHDRGVDIVARGEDGAKIAVQCKRQVGRVGADRVRNLIGAVNGATYRDHRAVLVTSSTFTRPAFQEAEGMVLLVDRHALGRWMKGERLKV
ncbi:hypothetical protein Skr01_73060 [Sphaerisporangium krabiense]|nr:hypothetical protein Skr01_73060 [Sphaerisporangium krabiense]